MFALRCTQKLLRSGVMGETYTAVSTTTRLGDWYANILFTRPERLVLCVSEVTLLPVVLPARPSATLLVRLPERVADVLLALGIDEPAVREEISQMRQGAVARTTSRRVLGSLDDFMFLLQTVLRHDPNRSLLDYALHLAGVPCSPLKEGFPDRATRLRFGVASEG